MSSEESSEFECDGEACEGCTECFPLLMRKDIEKWSDYTEEDKFWTQVASDWVTLVLSEDPCFLMEQGKDVLRILKKLKDGDLRFSDE